MIFKTCPYCGANLDPEEICDCEKSQLEHSQKPIDKYFLFDELGRPVPKLLLNISKESDE